MKWIGKKREHIQWTVTKTDQVHIWSFESVIEMFSISSRFTAKPFDASMFLSCVCKHALFFEWSDASCEVALHPSKREYQRE